MVKVKKYLEKCDHHDKEHDRKLSYSKGLNVACKSAMRYYMDGDIRNLVVGKFKELGGLKLGIGSNWNWLGKNPKFFQKSGLRAPLIDLVWKPTGSYDHGQVMFSIRPPSSESMSLCAPI